MGRETPDFDLLAIVVLALVLGVAQAPRLYVRTNGLEHRGPEFRIQNINPVIRVLPWGR
jgi:hypothetical protein